MICKNCGREIPDNSRYCAYCNTYVRNLDNDSEQHGAETVSVINESNEIKTETAVSETDNGGGKKGKGILIAVIAVIIIAGLAVGAVFALPVLKEKLKKEEITTTEPPVSTTEATTAVPSTTPPVTDHFGEAKETFYSLSDKLGKMLGDSASEFSVTDEKPKNSYGSNFAFNSQMNPGCVYIFTNRKSDASSRLKSVAGDISVILPGRSNYTYDELKKILGDAVKYDEKDGVFSVYYKANGYTVYFTSPVNTSLESALDSFIIQSDKEILPAKTTAAKTTVSSAELVKTNPDEYFKNNTAKKYTVVTKGDNLNVRSFAGKDNKVVATVANKESITVYGFYNGWAYIQKADGTKGWVSESFIKSAS